MIAVVKQCPDREQSRWCGKLAAIVFATALMGSGCAHSPAGRAPVVEAGAAKPTAKVAQQPKPKSAQAAPAKAKSRAAAILREQASAWRGVPYRYGGTSRRGVDCSAFVQITLRERLGIDVPRTTREQIQVGREVRRNELAPGDLVFFRTGVGGRHVGIYLGNSEFVHVSERAGVVVSKLDSSYWQNAYWQARRPEQSS